MPNLFEDYMLGAEFKRGRDDRKRTSELAGLVQQGDESAINEMALLNPDALRNLMTLPGLGDTTRATQETAKLQSLQAQAGQERVRLLKINENLGAALAGGPENLRVNLAKMAEGRISEDDPDFNLDEVAEMMQMATTEPEKAFARLQEEATSVGSQLSTIDQILGKEKAPASTQIEKLINARDAAEVAGDSRRVQILDNAINKATAAPTDQKTTNIKDFEFAKSQGFKGSFNDFMRQGQGLSKANEEELKATVKANVARLSDLKKTKKTRDSSIVKARRFLRAFESGDAESGTTRTVAGFLPGVFSDQAQFDQELDAFAEVAAREKLKAVGEIRPTDADVEGMKRALFGVGRDEKVNIQLLREFISEQENQNDELEDLIEAKKRGSLSSFTGGRGPGSSLQNLSDEELLNF